MRSLNLMGRRVGASAAEGRRFNKSKAGRRGGASGRAIKPVLENLENRMMLALTVTPTIPAPGSTNLTTEGGLDWIHFGYPDSATGLHRKNAPGPVLLNPFTRIGAAPTGTGDTTGMSVSWTDALPNFALAQDVTDPDDPVTLVNGQDDNDGAAGAPPGAETEINTFNNQTQKYLNFLDLNSGAAVAVDAAGPGNGALAVNAIRLYTANDATERDPMSYLLEGSNDGTNWTAISNGPLNLPLGRNAGGAIAIDPNTHFHQNVVFSNSTVYTNYRITFPTLRNAAAANSMQIGEIELLNVPVTQVPGGTTDAVTTSGAGNGFRLTAPASSLQTREVDVFVAVDNNTTGTLTASLSDNSETPVVMTLASNNEGLKVAKYTIEYKSLLADNRALQLDWVSTSGTGNVYLSAAALSGVTAQSVLTVTPTTPGPAVTNLTTEGNLDWRHWGFPDDANGVHFKAGVVGPRISNYTPIGTPTVGSGDTTGMGTSWTDATPNFGPAVDVTDPDDPVQEVRGTDDDDSLVGGVPGTVAAPPAAENQTMAFNNQTQKYLNFGEFGSGVIVTVDAEGVGNGSLPVNGIRIYTANDAEARDPTSYVLEGSNDGTTWSMISQGPLSLPAARNGGGAVAINPATQANQAVAFLNSTVYTNYRVTFPNIKNSAGTNSMQVAEIELLSGVINQQVVPPATTTDAVTAAGPGNGFSVTVPAVQNATRRANILVAVDPGTTGTLTATLSDGSSAPVSQILTGTGGLTTAKYQIDFRTSSPGTQTLKLDWVNTSGTGNVYLKAVDWNEFQAPAAATGLVATGTGKGRVSLFWTDPSDSETGWRIERAPDVAGAPGTFAPVATIGPANNGGFATFIQNGLPDNTTFHYRVVATGVAGESAASNTDSATTKATIVAPWSGLVGEYFHFEALPADRNTFTNTGTPVLKRREDGAWADGGAHAGPIDFNWATAAPPGVDLDLFGSRYTGRIVPDFNGKYTFFTDSDDGMRLSIDLNDNGTFEANELVVNGMFDQGFGVLESSEQLFRGGIDMVAGQPYNILVEHYENGGGAGARLRWANTLQGDQVIPTQATLPLPNVVAPAANPTTVVATPLNSGRALVEWQYAGPEATGDVWYFVERAPDAAGVPGTFARVGSTTEKKFIDGSSALNTRYHYRVTAQTSGGFSQPAVATSILTQPAPVGTGARATYYDDPNSETPSKTPILGSAWPNFTTDATINFNYGGAAPAVAAAGTPPVAFGADDFAIIWSFQLKPEFTGLYTFHVDVDDGAKLMIGDQVVIDELDRRGGQGPQLVSVPVQLTAGQNVSVRLFMIEGGGQAGARLKWSSDKVKEEIIPARVMYPEAPDPTPPTVTDVAVDGHIPATATYTPASHLVIKFSEPVFGVDVLDFGVADPNGSLWGGEVFNVVYDAASNSAIMTFPFHPEGTQTLADGNYQLFITAAGITDGFGNALDGDNNQTPGGNATIPFYVLRGDTQVAHNGTPKKDRKIDFVDYQVMSKNFGMTNPSAADGDFTLDGVIDNQDFLWIRQRFGNTLAPPPAAPVSAPTPTPTPVMPKPVASKPVASKPTVLTTTVTETTATATAAAAAAAAVTPAKPTPLVKPTPAKFATRKIDSKDLLV